MGYTKVTDIPAIMRDKKWDVGAALMEHWFSLPACVAPPYVNRNDSIVKMNWILGYKRAKSVYDSMISEKVWSNEKAKPLVRKFLEKYGLASGRPACFGVFQSTQPVIHENAVNFRKVADSDTMDDLRAALANFTFHVQIGGQVRPSATAGKCCVTVTHVGVYARDQYEFDGFQYLGRWDKRTNSVDASKYGLIALTSPYGHIISGGAVISNATFRAWRRDNNRGGDFEVFSDVLIVPLRQPDEFEV